MRRRLLPITAALAVFSAAALVGCSSTSGATGASASGSSDCEPLVNPGALSSSIRLSGDSAQNLRVTVGRNLESDRPERSIVAGDGTSGGVIMPGTIVAANLAEVDGETGELLSVSDSFGTETGDTLFLAETGTGTIADATICARAGETVAVVLSSQESAYMGIDGAGVIILQITDVHAPRATGQLRALPSGFPAVTTDETGRPGIVLPPQSVPSDLRSAVRIQGSGDPVEADDIIVVQILSVNWDGTIDRNTWTTGPVSVDGEENAAEAQATFRAAITGVPLGSQLVVIEPEVNGGRVSVIDILAVA